jgi:hypothetical protein
MASSHDIDYGCVQEQDVPLLNASVVYTSTQSKILKPVKERIAAAVATATQVPVTCRVPQLAKASIDALCIWAGERGWELTFGSDTETKSGYGGDNYEERYYYVSLEKVRI